jgi:NAD(P)-dependent dehydrogenase (short-subunit alcohol dehydrogenase family)
MHDTSMQGKVCLVTGATSGIGQETARVLADRGATVVIVGRNPAKVAETVKEIQAATHNQQVSGLVGDLSVQAEVRRVAQAFLAQHDRLHVLINNAGMLSLQRRTTPDGLESTFALNHMGYFLLTNLLLPTLKASAPARIVNVASDAHRGARLDFADLQGARSYRAMRAYGQSKLANIMFTYELARRLQGTGLTANALHPGFVASGFARNNGPVVAFFMNTLLRPMQISNAKGAATSIYLATSPEVEGVTGKYFDRRKPVASSDASYNQADQQRLWEISEGLIKELAQATAQAS